MTVEEVRGSLDLTDNGAIKNSIRNCLTVFQNDPVLQGAVRYNILTERIDIVKPLWWSKQTATLTDTDLNYLMLYLEDKYSLTSEKKIQKALSIIADSNKYHPITLSINGKEQAVTVAGILSDSPLAREEGTETIFCSEKTFVALTGQTGYTIIDVQFQNGASIEDVKDIENIFTDGGVVFTEQLSQVQQQRNLYSAFAVLVYGFLSIIVAITIFHIMNTINMGAIAKTKQYGTMRAIGMSNQQLIKMIVAEAMTYAVSGIILGCIIGLPMHWVVFASLITNFWGTAWSIPIFPLALIIGIVLFTSFLAVRSPAKRLHDMAIVDTIKSQQ